MKGEENVVELTNDPGMIHPLFAMGSATDAEATGSDAGIEYAKIRDQGSMRVELNARRAMRSFAHSPLFPTKRFLATHMSFQMHVPVLTLRENALLYIVKLITGSTLVWFGLRAVGVAEPYWAMISLIVVTEPDVTIAKTNFQARLINTINGAVVACLALVLFGSSFFSMLVAMTISVLVAMSLQNYPSNWRLAPSTAVILMAAALNGSGLPEEFRLAMSRILEVMTGSTVALVQTLAYAYLLGRWRS